MEPALTLVTLSNKAVAVGAISFYVDHFVTGRISKFTYGAACSAPYNFFNSEHRKREHLSFLNPAGERRIPDYFETMLPRVRYPPPSMIFLETSPHYRAPRFWRTEKFDTASVM